MRLDFPEDRWVFLTAMRKRTFNFQEALIHDREHGDDWLGAMTMVEYLDSIGELIRTEDIFYYTMDDISEVRNPKGNDVYLNITYEHLVHFVDEILLPRIEFTLDFIADWNFVLERGQRLKKYLVKRLEQLVQKYQDVYDL